MDKDSILSRKENFVTDATTKIYFGYPVTAYRSAEASLRGYPQWRFSIKFDGKRHYYGGTPNFTETKAQALRRGWWRAKWLKDGTYHTRYSNGG